MHITVSDVTVSEDEFAQVAATQWLQNHKNRWPLWIYGVAALYFLVRAGIRVFDRFGDPNAPLPVFELALVALIGLFAVWWRPYRIKQHFRKTYRSAAGNQAAATYIFREDVVESRSELTQGSSRYELFTKAVFRGRWLLLYISEGGFVFVDLLQIRPPTTPAGLRQLLQRKGVPVTEA